MASLLILEGPQAGAQRELGAETTLGRSPTCDLVIEDPNVSRRHAQILLVGEQASLVDLGSRNGIQLNGQRIVGTVPLHPGDRVQVGQVLFAFDPAPLRVFAPASGGVHRIDPPALSEAPIPAVLRPLFDQLARVPTPAAVLRVAVENALAIVQAEQGLLLSLPAADGGVGRPEVLSLSGSQLFTVPAGFEGALREGVGACDDQHLAVPVGLPGQRLGAIVLQRRQRPFEPKDGALLFDLARLATRIAEGATVRQELRALSFPLVLWRERPALLSAAFHRCLERIEQAARHHGPLLLVGEPATGRDELALTLHQMGRSSDGPFVRWRLPAVDPLQPEKLPPPESILNVLQRAEGGTLYLGNISAWSVPLAELWVRALDRFTPSLLGGDARLPSPVRLVAASADPIAKLKGLGCLPAALLLRFEGERVEVPALRQRKGDLPLLVERLSTAAGQRLGRPVPRFSAAAMKALTDYAWPGNLAELQVCLEWALFACGPETDVQLRDLPPQVRTGEASDREKPRPLAQMISAIERTAIVEALRESGFRKIHAAAALGISRPTLDKKIAEYEIHVEVAKRAVARKPGGTRA